jgi:hypothetical protein
MAVVKRICQIQWKERDQAKCTISLRQTSLVVPSIHIHPRHLAHDIYLKESSLRLDMSRVWTTHSNHDTLRFSRVVAYSGCGRLTIEPGRILTVLLRCLPMCGLAEAVLSHQNDLERREFL